MRSKTNKELLHAIIQKGENIDIHASVEIKELARRVVRPQHNDMIQIDRPQTIKNWLQLEIGDSGQEHFMALYLNKQNRLLDYKTLFTGTLDRSVVHPRDIFREAVKLNASRIILVHNHPSGSTTPSRADIKTTEILIDAGHMMGIMILDHLIVAQGGGFTSVRENNPYMFISEDV